MLAVLEGGLRLTAVVSASLLLGVVYLHAGLMAAMATHFGLDMTVLLLYRYQIAAVPERSIV